MDIEKERQAFEACIASLCHTNKYTFKRSGGAYVCAVVRTSGGTQLPEMVSVQTLWEVWQACRRMPVEAKAAQVVGGLDVASDRFEVEISGNFDQQPQSAEAVAYTTAGMLAIAKELPLTGRIGARCKADDRWNVPLYTAPQPSAAPDAITMADVMRAWEYAEDHPHKYLRGTTNWCAAMAYSLNQQRVAAPSAPKAEDPVKVQLLEALEAAEKKLCIAEYHLDKGEDDSVVFESEILLARAAIAAARQEGGK